MSLPQIYADLQAAAAAGTLTGNAPEGLGDLLSSLGAGSLPVVGGQASLGPDSAWLTGTTTFLNSQWSILLTARDADDPAHPGRAALVLELTLAEQAESWTLGQAFGALLPKSRVAAPESGGLVLAPSVLAPLVLQQPVVTAANKPDAGFVLPRLQGSLPLDGTSSAGSDELKDYAAFLGTPLYVDGTIDFADAAHPVLDLPAVAPGATLTIAELTVSEVGIRLTTAYADPSFLTAEDAPRSAALLYAKVALPTNPPDVVEISGPLLIGDNVWPLMFEFAEPLTLEGGIQALLTMAGVSDANAFELPAGIAPINEFGLSDVGFGIQPPVDATPPGLAYAAIGITSTRPWDPPIPFLTINEVGTQWAFFFGAGEGLPVGEQGRPVVTGSVFGTMTFGQKKAASLGAQAPVGDRAARGELVGLTAEPADPSDPVPTDVVVTVRLDLPDLAFTAYTEEPFSLPISQAFKAFFDSDAPFDEADLVVQDLSMLASLPRKEFAAGLNLSGRWDVHAGDVVISLTGLELQVFVSQTEVSGRIQGTAAIAVPDSPSIELIAAAEYPGTGFWIFEAALQGTLKLPQLVYGLIGVPPPQWVKDMDLELANLAFRYSTAPGKPYSAQGTLRLKVGETLLGFDMRLEMTAAIERKLKAKPADETMAVALRDTPQVDPETITAGSLSGTFAINRFAVTAKVSVTDAGKTYTFIVAYRDLALTATTSYVGTDVERHQVLTLRLSGATLGSMVEYLVGLANPNANYRLDPPWDFLNTIDLNAFALVIDPTLQTVSLTYDVKLDLGFVDIQSVGVRYERASGTPTVKFVLNAKMLGDTEAKPLTWDAVNQAPPAVPGKGQSLFDLRYLGLGQHVTPKGLTAYTSITDVVDALVKDMRPITDLRKVPLDPAKMQFDPSSQWMFGIDAKIMDTLSVKMVMHDPDLYGVVIALSGPEAKSLAGLNVELLYKKVTNDIGVFHARLQIPDAFRKLQFGAVSVTLGIITVDIFTNGDFKIDLGFPHNNDWSVSFAVEAGIFNGKGGIYFGLLSGATSTRVPAVTNGTFSPVLELGVGLSVGVGRTFQAGPLSAGMYVNLVVVFEGALAWFHPDQGDAPTELYYWCRGTAGIVGKIYGSVDFKVISVDVSLEVSAMVTFELEAYKASTVELSVNVRANASVKIVFFRIHFSFSLELRTSFVIGSDSTPPWQVAPGQATRSLRAAAAVRAPSGDALGKLGAIALPDLDVYRLHFDKDAKVFPDRIAHQVGLKLVPGYTVAGVPVNWSGDGVVPPNPDPAYRLVVMLVADNAIRADAVTIADTHEPDVSRNALAATAADTSFNQVAEGMMRWSLNALGVTAPDAVVTLAQLQELDRQLAFAHAADTGFTWENLQGFFANNLHLVVSGTPTGPAADDLSGTPFPMLPVLQWESPDLPDPAQRTRQFWEYQRVDATYEKEAAEYFALLDPRPPQDSPAAAQAEAASDEPAESMATFVLRDYFRLVARTATQAAVSLLSSFPYEVTETDSLQLIAGLFPTTTVDYVVTAGDTVERAAEAIGLSAAELTALNPGFAAELAAAAPGTSLTVVVGVTPQSIAVANPAWPVTAGSTVHLGTITAQVQAGDTLEAVAQRYGVGADEWVALDSTRTATPLLRKGAAVPLPGFVYPNPTGLSVDQAAAVFFVRLGMVLPTDVPLSAWYAQAILQLNPTVGDGPLPPVVDVPRAYQDIQDPTPWETLPGDTVLDVAAYAALGQNVLAGSPFEAWLLDVRATNDPAPAAGVSLPADAAAVVLANDTLARLDDRLLSPAQFADYVKPVDMLVPLVSVDVPAAVVQAGEGLTLLTLAQAFGLSLENLAGRMGADAGVLAPAVKGKPLLQIPDVAAIALADLVDALHSGEPMAAISGQVARFMLYGLRLPAPELHDGVYQATGPMTGVYELIGQQVQGPAPAPPPPPPPPSGESAEDPPPPVATITVSKGQAADWLTFAESAVLGPEHDDAAVTGLLARNPALAERSSLAGIIALGDEADAAVLSITEQDLVDNYPATRIGPVVIDPLAPMALSHEQGVRYPVAQVIPWQTTDAPLLPGPAAAPTAGAPSLWPFSADLMDKAAGGESASRFLLEQVLPQAGAKAPVTELSSYAWGLLVGFAVRRIPGLPGTVEVLGANTADRQRLALVLDYLGAVAGKQPAVGALPPPPAGEAAHLKLLWQLPPTPGMAPGLTSMPMDAGATFIVQTNLSTETHSGSARAQEAAVTADPTAGSHFASIADAERFITLLWECSVVGGGGYWMRFKGDGADGADVPETIFDQDGLAQLSLLVQMSSQSTIDAAKAWPVRKLLAFNNCAVVGDAVDPGSVALSARPVDPVELRPAASVDPGQVGFTIRLANPTMPGATGGLIAQLYSLLGYQLLATAGFAGSEEGRPVGPQTPPSQDEMGLPLALAADEGAWSLARAVDISRFALSRLPALPAAPDPALDPYAGIVSGSGTQAVVWLQDVYGNASAKPTEGPGLLPIPVQYTDPMLGPGTWPSTTMSYTVAPSGDVAKVVVAVDLQAVAYQPEPTEAGAASAAKAGRDRDRLTAAYFQVMQPGVHAALLTSLQQPEGTPPVPLPVDVEVLRRYVLGARALLSTESALSSAVADPSVAASLNAVCDQYGVEFDGLAAANGDAVLVDLLAAAEVQVPVTVAFRGGDTVAGLCNGLSPAPDPAVVLQDEDNVVLPLMAGTELSTPMRSVPVPASSMTAAEAADACQCTLATLVAGNCDRPGLLTPGFVFECNGVKVGVAPTPPQSETTLTLVAETFNSLGVPLDAAQVVALNAQAPGMFRQGVELSVDGYVAVSGDTLLDNKADLTPAALAPLNTATVDLFPPGTPLLLTTKAVTPGAGDTLGYVAAVEACPPGSLLRHNGTAPLGTASPVVPGTWAWPDAAMSKLRVPYTVRPGDSLAAVAARFLSIDAVGLAAINAAMPGVVAADATIEVDGKSATTTAPSSLDGVAALFTPPVPVADLAAAIAGRDDVLADGALLVCPPGVVMSGGDAVAATAVTAADAAAPFGVATTAFLSANAGTPDMLVTVVQLSAWPPGPVGSPVPPVETVAPHDTLTAIVERFRSQGASTSIDLLAAANPTAAFIRVGAVVLVPPATACLSAEVGSRTTEGVVWSFPSPVFPLHVALELARPEAQVDPSLLATARRDTTVVPAGRSADAAQNGAMTLAAFATDVEAAVPVLRLATGKVASETTTDVWGVVFDAAGVESVKLFPPLPAEGPEAAAPQPRSFALRPLANTLIARSNVTTKQFDVATGTLGAGETRNYQGVDLDVWARSFLIDVELLLSAAYARGAYALNRPALDQVAEAKKALAAAVAGGLDFVLQGETGGEPKRKAASEALRQRLLVSLSAGYDTSAVLQYDTVVASPWATDYARLSGNPVTTFKDEGALKTATVSNGKVSLASGSSQVSFSVNVPDVAAQKSLGLQLDYRVVELEFAITPEIEGYEKSDWLTFLTPVGTGLPDALQLDLGLPTVPLPLRAYPPMPILVEHSAEVPTSAETLAGALHWAYQFSLQHQSAAQDTIGFEVAFNQTGGDTVFATAEDDLFAALAQYMAVAAPMLGLLAAVASAETPPDPQGALRAGLQTFADLATAVATAWAAHWSDPAPAPPTADAAVATGGGPVLDVYDFTVKLTAADDTWYTTLKLVRDKTSGPGTVDWPSIRCIPAGGAPVELTPVDPALCQCEDPDRCRCYAFPYDPDAPKGNVAAFTLLTFEFTFPGLHVASYQNASARTWVTRNAKLLGDSGPDTTTAFVYRTPDVSYPKPVVPFIDISGPIAIGDWPDHPLAPVFDAVFDGHAADRVIAVGVRYAYTLVPGDPPVEALLPVLQSTVGPYLNTTIATLTTAVDGWKDSVQPATVGGGWAFWISLYSSLDPDLQRPVLQLKRLSSSLAPAPPDPHPDPPAPPPDPEPDAA